MRFYICNKNYNLYYNNMIKNLIVKINVEKSECNLNNPKNISNIQNSTGTGFFIKKNYILTCYHVIKDSIKISISHHTTHKKKIHVSVHSIYPDDDLAVLFINNDNLPSSINFDTKIPIYVIDKNLNDDNNNVDVIGYPLNSKVLKQTKGILSGYQESLFQTDATLNPGNSGGPLIWNNKIIGINAAKLSSEQVDNVGYAIPIQRFLIYMNTLKEHTTNIYKKPLLGASFQFIENNKQFEKFNLLYEKVNGDYYGIRIIKLAIDSVLYNANLRIGDFLLEWDNNIIDMYGDIKINKYPEKVGISEICKWYYVGQKINIKYYSINEKRIKSEEVILTFPTNRIKNYYKNYSDTFYHKISNLTFSIITSEHLKKINKLDLELEDKIYIMNNFLTLKNNLIVYLVNQTPDKTSISLPEGSVVTKINDKEIKSSEELFSIKEIKIIEFLTGYKYFI